MHAKKSFLKPATGLIALAAVAGLGAAFPLAANAQNSAIAAALSEDNTYDKVVFRNGRIIEGQILEETTDTIRMRIVVAGISTVTTYSRADILNIEKDLKVEGAEIPAKPGDRPGSSNTKSSDAKSEVREGAPRVYHFTLKGNFGRDITGTPLTKAFETAVSASPDVIIIEMDASSRGGFDGLFAARIEEMTPMIERAMANGQRVVFWIDQAVGGAAFLPFVSPEIYFQKDGRLGGIGSLQDFDMGNDRVNEKQISLRLGHAEGLAITGGYAPELIRAMARQDYWLAYRIRGGQIEFMQREPTAQDKSDGWLLLTDDGKGQNEDKMEDVVRGRGNDVLNLDADTAVQLQVSDGTADTLDDLVFLLGYGREYNEFGEDSEKVMKDWADRIDRAEESLQRLSKDIESAEQGGNRRTVDDARRAIGEQIRRYQQVISILGQYSEVFDPSGAQRSQAELRIAELRLSLQRLR
jgi:hypothetical protein